MKKNNKNNKGFSLVELIIVIAIMAILIGVLAPQYLKFVERSRVSTDKQNVDEIIRSLEVWASDVDAGTNSTVAITTDATGTTITLDHDADIVIAGSNKDAFEDAIEAYGLELSTRLKSSNWGTDKKVVITVTVDSNMNLEATDTNSVGIFD